MKSVLCITAYDRPDLFKQCLENLIVKYPCGADKIVVSVDGMTAAQSDASGNVAVMSIAQDYYNRKLLTDLDYSLNNCGVAKTTNKSIYRASLPGIGPYGTHDDCVIIHCDSDTYIQKTGWCKDVVDFLDTHREVGLIAPDIPGRYMRLHRYDYDEIEYALGMVWATRRSVCEEVIDYLGKGFFDEHIQHQFDPDICYRIRMKGYRVGVKDFGKLVDLGVSTGDSSRSETVSRGGFEFLKKWNLYFTGQFSYKSPMMLRWDEFPLNYLWRRLWLSQFDFNQSPPRVSLQNHDFDLINVPVTPSKWLLKECREALQYNLTFKGTSNYSSTDNNLLTGKRGWNVQDNRNSE